MMGVNEYICGSLGICNCALTNAVQWLTELRVWPGLLRSQIGSHTSSSEDLKTILMELQSTVAVGM